MASGPAFQMQGERTSGQDVRTQNVTAVAAIANIVKTSLGPVGLDKARDGAVMFVFPAAIRVLSFSTSGDARRCWWTTLAT